jgi:hypothetical protein
VRLPSEKERRNQIVNAMVEISRAGADPLAPFFHWAIPDELACAQRPLRYHPVYVEQGLGSVPVQLRGEVLQWIGRVVDSGFQSIMCLATPQELGYYDGLDLSPGGLRGACEARGLVFESEPWPDPHHGRDLQEKAERLAMEDGVKHRAWDRFQRLGRPVLMFCSAAIQRSPPVAAYIAAREAEIAGQ